MGATRYFSALCDLVVAHTVVVNMFNFDPFAWWYNLLGFIEEQWQKLALFDRIRNSWVANRLFGAYMNMPLVPSLKDSALVQKAQESEVAGKLDELRNTIPQLILAPFQWFVDLIGLSFEWVVSRSWIGIALNTIPTLILVIATFSAWIGSRLDRVVLSDHYFRIANIEIENATRMAEAAAKQVDKQSDQTPQPQGSNGEPEKQPVPENSSSNDEAKQSRDYAELLFHRSFLLVPKTNMRLIVGTAMVNHGLYAGGRKLLKPIAPESGRGMVAAHNAIAISWLNEYRRKGDQATLAKFQHHAEKTIDRKFTPMERSLGYSTIPIESYLALTAIQKNQGNLDKAMKTMLVACRTYPNLYGNVTKMATELKDPKLAGLARQQEIDQWRAMLDKNPEDFKARIHLAQLLPTDSEGLVQTERLLKEGIELGPQPVLSRALSEVYRIKFVRNLIESNYAVVDLVILDAALQIDPSNPLVAEQICNLVEKRVRPIESLTTDLSAILASGVANIGVHALLAQIKLAQNDAVSARLHLEQVFQATPSAAKFTDQLMQLYLAGGKANEAIQAGSLALSTLERDELQKERFVDGLYHTMGIAYLQVQKDDLALQAFENALKANPDRLDTHMALADYFRRNGKLADATTHEQFVATHRGATAPSQQPATGDSPKPK